VDGRDLSDGGVVERTAASAYVTWARSDEFALAYPHLRLLPRRDLSAVLHLIDPTPVPTAAAASPRAPEVLLVLRARTCSDFTLAAPRDPWTETPGREKPTSKGQSFQP
jgi:hypothetical protein